MRHSGTRAGAERPGRRAARQAETRERLLAAGLLVVARDGDAASVRDIAGTAGLTQGALYANFAGREGLLLELLRRHMAEEEEAISAALDAAGDDGMAALRNLGAWAARLDEAGRPNWAAVGLTLRLHASRSAAFAGDYDALHAAHRRSLGIIVTRLFGVLGKPLPGDAEEIAEGFVALAHGLALGRSAGARPGAAGRTVALFLRALAGVADAPP